MKSRQFLFPNIEAIVAFKNEDSPLLSSSKLVLGFASRGFLEQPDLYKCLNLTFPNSQILLCSTSGQILGESVYDEGIIINIISFDHTEIHCYSSNIKDFENSMELAEAVAHKFDLEKLQHILVFSDGQLINGSQLVEGFNKTLPQNINISGGMAGDGNLFQKTLVALNETPKEGTLAAIGFYGDRIQISNSFKGGWDIFGPKRKITKSKDNVLYELDGESALSLYKKYLGPLADGLPSNALFFPLAISDKEDPSIVRTILSINEKEQSMTFAGDMPQGSYARLMKSNLDRLIGASGDAAQIINDEIEEPDLILLISCVGRRIVMSHRVEEELEAVIDTFEKNQEIKIAGFYSYGELSPHTSGNFSDLHNQTITITAFKEL